MNLKHVIKNKIAKWTGQFSGQNLPPLSGPGFPFWSCFAFFFQFGQKIAPKKFGTPVTPPLFQKCLTLFGQGLNPPPLLGIAQI